MLNYCGSCRYQEKQHNIVCASCKSKDGIPTNFELKGKLVPIQNMNFDEKPEDIINKPNHYHKNEIDVNGYLEKHFPKEGNVTVAEGFYIGNVIKYVSRHKEKGGKQDLDKAMFNLNKLIEMQDK